jgi:uncharacterized DUF497 family protein
MYYDWSRAKNEWLKAERGVCFEDILTAFDEGNILETIEHPNRAKYPHQKQLIVNIRGYIYLVPYVENDEKIFFKTIIPSRKATKERLKGGK